MESCFEPSRSVNEDNQNPSHWLPKHAQSKFIALMTGTKCVPRVTLLRPKRVEVAAEENQPFAFA